MRFTRIAAATAALALGGAAAAAAHTDAQTATVWDDVARCVSAGDWQHAPILRNQSAIAYSGGLMLTDYAWKRYGGLEYAARPYQATKTEQIAVAENIAADNGPHPTRDCDG